MGITRPTCPDLKHSYDFQNWMRTAAVPNFSKLYMRNDNQTMVPGQYQVRIGLNYDVEKWNGRKAFQISTLSLIGGRNVALGIIFLVVGGFCLIMDVIFVVGICIKPRKLGDAYLPLLEPGSRPVEILTGV